MWAEDVCVHMSIVSILRETERKREGEGGGRREREIQKVDMGKYGNKAVYQHSLGNRAKTLLTLHFMTIGRSQHTKHTFTLD